MEARKGLDSAMKLLPCRIADSIRVCGIVFYEIRLRAGRPVTLTTRDGYCCIDRCIVTSADIETVITRAMRNSVHSCAEQLRAGYVSYENGCRVGFSGTYAASEGAVTNIKVINSVCIRVPREVRGCADGIFQKCLSVRPSSVLLFGAPSSGKTTYLRDLARICGQHYRTALIDERGELASVSMGMPMNDVGMLTDVFDRYPRKTAIETAIRVMSPQIVVCDEIGSYEDAASLSYALNSGVKLICTCHCDDREELFSKENIGTLLSAGIFEHIVHIEKCGVVDISGSKLLPCLNS